MYYFVLLPPYAGDGGKLPLLILLGITLNAFVMIHNLNIIRLLKMNVVVSVLYCFVVTIKI